MINEKFKVKNVYESEGIKSDRFVACRDLTIKELGKRAKQIKDESDGVDLCEALSSILVPNIKQQLHRSWTLIKVLSKVDKGLIDYILMYYMEEGIFETLLPEEKLAFCEMTDAVMRNVKQEVGTNNLFKSLMSGLSDRYTESLLRIVDDTDNFEPNEVYDLFFDGLIEYVSSAVDFIGIREENSKMAEEIVDEIREAKKHLKSKGDLMKIMTLLRGKYDEKNNG